LAYLVLKKQRGKCAWKRGLRWYCSRTASPLIQDCLFHVRWPLQDPFWMIFRLKGIYNISFCYVYKSVLLICSIIFAIWRRDSRNHSLCFHLRAVAFHRCCLGSQIQIHYLYLYLLTLSLLHGSPLSVEACKYFGIKRQKAMMINELHCWRSKTLATAAAQVGRLTEVMWLILVNGVEIRVLLWFLYREICRRQLLVTYSNNCLCRMTLNTLSV